MSSGKDITMNQDTLDRTIIIPPDVFEALRSKAASEAERVAGKVPVEDHPIARIITPKSLAQKILRNFAEKKCGDAYVPSRNSRDRSGDE